MAYHLEGRLLEVCNCRVLCPCWIGEDPDFGTCDTIVAWHFDKGTIDGVDVSDRTIAMIAHVPGNILQGNWRAAVYLDERVHARSRRRRCSPSTRARRAGPIAISRSSSAKSFRSRKCRSRSPCRAAAARSSSATPATPSSSRTRAPSGATTTLDRHGVLDGAGRAGVRRQGAELQVEEREARHRSRHQGPQRAAEHVRVRRASGAPRRAVAEMPRRTGAAAMMLRRPFRHTHARCRAADAASRAVLAAARAARRRRVGRAVAVEREPLRALSRSRRLGRCWRARRAVPGRAAGRHRGAGVLHAARGC